MTHVTRTNFKEIFPQATMTWAGIVNVQTKVQPVFREEFVGDTYNKRRFLLLEDILHLMYDRIDATKHLNSQGAYLPMWNGMIDQCIKLIQSE